jgi:hypothetical protein
MHSIQQMAHAYTQSRSDYALYVTVTLCAGEMSAQFATAKEGEKKLE